MGAFVVSGSWCLNITDLTVELLVAVIDAQLLKRVVREAFKTKNVEDPDRGL